MRLLLVLTVVIAVIALLLASWQWGKRVFAITATVTAVSVVILIYGVLEQGEKDQVTLPPDGVRVEVAETLSSESGVRFTGTIYNDGELDLAGATLRATALKCAQGETDCKPVHQHEELLLIFIPAGRHYAFAMVSRHPDGDVTPDKWKVEPVSRLAYPQS